MIQCFTANCRSSGGVHHHYPNFLSQFTENGAKRIKKNVLREAVVQSRMSCLCQGSEVTMGRQVADRREATGSQISAWLQPKSAEQRL